MTVSIGEPRTTKFGRICAALIASLAIAAIASPGFATGSSGGVGTATEPAAHASAGSGEHTASKYDRIWSRVSAADRRWAERTSECESGGDPKAIGGGGIYRGAFQFMRSTWAASPKSPGGDPIAYPYRTQAVVAVMLMRRDGAGHWPVCG